MNYDQTNLLRSVALAAVATGTVYPGMRSGTGNRRAGPIYRQHYEPKLSVGRNDPCLCRSGKKFKRCCLRGSQAGTVQGDG